MSGAPELDAELDIVVRLHPMRDGGANDGALAGIDARALLAALEQLD